MTTNSSATDPDLPEVEPTRTTRRARLLRGSKDGGNGALALAAQMIQNVGSLAIVLLAARFLSPAEYGVYSIATIFLLLLQELTFAGVTQYIVTQKGDEKSLLSTTFWLIFGFSTAGAILLIVTAPLLAMAFDAPELTTTLVLLAVVQPVAAYTAWASAILMRRKQMNTHFSLLGMQNLVSIVGGVATLFVWQSIFALVAYRYFRVFSGMLGYMVFVREWPSFRLDKVLGRELLKYSSHLYGTRFMQFLSNYGADLMLGLTLSTTAAGLYRLGNRLAMVPVEFIGQPIRTFALAQFGDAHRHDKPFSPLAAAFISSQTFLMGGIGSTVAVFGTEMVTYLFQPAYLAALPVTMALVVRSVLGIGDAMLEPVLAAVGKTKIIFIHRTFWAIVTVAAMFAAAPFGPGVVAWTLAAVTVFASGMAFRHFIHHCDIHLGPLLIALAKSLFLVAIYYAGAWLIHHELAANLSLGLGEWLLVSLGGCLFFALILAGVALKMRVLVLGIFSGH